MPDYLDVTYSDKRAPKGGYPLQLAEYLEKKYFRPPGKLLDVGCGRGDFLEAFDQLGYTTYGLDKYVLSDNWENVAEIDLEKDVFPHEDELIEYIFSKSVVEHLQDPTVLLGEAYRVLEYGGRIVIMTPSWEHTYKSAFYVDHTHVTPFTPISLQGVLEIAGFQDVTVDYFYQLPFVWKTPALKILAQAISLLPLPYAPNKKAPWKVSSKINKLLRFSKEPMLLATGTKKL